MTPAPHRIRTQRWLARTRAPDDALALRQRLRDDWRDVLLPAFAAAFDEVVEDDQVVHIARLEVQIHLDTLEAATYRMTELIHQQLARQLRPMAARTPPLPGPMPWRRHSAHSARRKALERYVSTGLLPWWLTHLDPAAAVDQLRAAAVETAESPRDISSEGGSSRVDPARLFRLLQLLPDTQWAVVARRLDDSTLAAVMAILAETAVERIGRYATLQLAAPLLAVATSGAPAVTVAELRVAAAHLLALLPEAVAHAVQHWLAVQERRGPVPPPEGLPAVLPPPSTALSPHGGLTPPPAPSPGGAQSPPAPENELPEAGLTVHHAGLVLLHPFLSTYFERTQVTRADQRGLPVAVQARAAALLYTLATGRRDVYEFELPFIKVLVGLRPEAPLPIADGLVEPADEAEAEELLRAVIGHWRVLKDTSVAALRQSFLERDGYLTDAEDGWHLRLEPTPFDVLLDHLPWSFGIVTLPWLEQPIWTEWQAR